MKNKMQMTIPFFLVPLFGLILMGCGSRRGTDPGPAYSVSPAVAASADAAGTTGPAADRRTAAVVFVEYVTTPQDVVERMLELAAVTKEDVVYDLGCGDGRIVVTAARRYGCRAVGYDLDLLRVREARQNAAEQGVAHLVTIEQQDVLKVDLQDATVVALYMGAELNARLIPQLRKLRPGARIVSHEFPIGALPPERTVRMSSRLTGRRHTIYLWTCPLPPPSH
ncbi:MAG: methyltransferase domain-containing protein [Planctomycetes bacterium]|nr:methyltransferase domain-containing protein [Planctomycetota bacterium]